MRAQEVSCFARALECRPDAIATHDLLTGGPGRDELDQCDLVLIGGSGEYSVADEGDWLDRALAGLREIAELRKPMFASCWGFQAISRALGGTCIHDLPNAELGTIEMTLTGAGREDPLFGALPWKFRGHAGHEDHVTQLPPGAVLLASSERVANQAFKLEGAPIYCTQFHPELQRQTFLERIANYPRYIEQIAGVPAQQFAQSCTETPEANALLKRFAQALQATDYGEP